MTVRVGVLALQGAFAAHVKVLEAIGADVAEVRAPVDLDGVDAMVLPGGESGTMSQLLESSGLFDPLAGLLSHGLPVLGTCAGLILLATSIADGRPGQRSFGLLDVSVRRNAYGRQRESFEIDLDLSCGQLRGVFIRAPRIERVGPGVEVMARCGGDPVLVTQGAVIGASFHPELSASSLVHEYLVNMANERKA